MNLYMDLTILQELKSLKPNYVDKDFKTGKAHPKLNMTKSVLPGIY